MIFNWLKNKMENFVLNCMSLVFHKGKLLCCFVYYLLYFLIASPCSCVWVIRLLICRPICQLMNSLQWLGNIAEWARQHC